MGFKLTKTYVQIIFPLTIIKSKCIITIQYYTVLTKSHQNNDFQHNKIFIFNK